MLTVVCVVLLLSIGVSGDTLPESPESVATSNLQSSCVEGDLAGVIQAIADGADLDAPGIRGGQTPFMSSAIRGNVEIARELVKAGADISIGESKGYTAIHGASFQGHSEMLKYLIDELGFDPNDVHEDGFTPLHRVSWGIEPRHLEAARLLISYGVRPDVPDTLKGRTAIDMAGSRVMQDLLIEELKNHDEL